MSWKLYVSKNEMKLVNEEPKSGDLFTDFDLKSMDFKIKKGKIKPIIFLQLKPKKELEIVFVPENTEWLEKGKS
jgi:hypothetical protein